MNTLMNALAHFRPALVMILIMTLLTGFAYPLLVTGAAKLLFPHQAAGSLLTRDGATVGSQLIGQNFTGAGYFHPRPSATVAPDPKNPDKTIASPYNAAASGASNLAPSAKALQQRVKKDAALLARENPGVAVPIELVTTSASGLDPHLSPLAARFQAPRIAKARQIAEKELLALIDAHIRLPLAGILGEPYVTVLEINLALDTMKRQ